MDVQKKLHHIITNKKRKQDARKIWMNKQSNTTKRKTKPKNLRKEKIVINKQSFTTIIKTKLEKLVNQKIGMNKQR